MNTPIRFLAVPVLCAAASCAHAQLIDEVDFRRDGQNAVLQIRFVTPVQFRRAAEAATSDSTQAFYDVVVTSSLPPLVSSERRVKGGGAMPDITIKDEPVGRAELSRKLVLSFSTPVASRVRAGAGNRTIEVVLDGLAASIPRAVIVPSAPPESTGQFLITLLQSDSPNLQLDTPIPASLQRYQVFTGQRAVGGRTVHETNIGYFQTLVEAEAARKALIRRFPNATIVSLVPTPPLAAAPAPVVPAVPVAPPLPAAAASAPGPVVAAPASAASAPEAAPAEAPVAAAPPTSAEVEARAAQLLAEAKAADAQQDTTLALDKLNQLLNLPPNASTREAQALIGDLRAKAGDSARARAEYELFLRLYPSGPDADRVRRALAALPAAAAPTARAKPVVEPSSSLTGSVSAFFFGGASKVRTQDFQDSPISGLPELVGDNTLSGEDQRQIMTNADVNWRYRDADKDMRFVFRDNYLSDQMRSDKSRNRLTALYFEHRSLTLGTNVRLGRQSPTGGGVLGRFDGVTAGYAFVPKWRINGVAGVPTDKLLDSKRRFQGVSIDADALTTSLSGSVYGIRQTIDGEVDRSAVGLELRYFKGGVSVSSMFDYDELVRGMNITSVQGTWQFEETSVVNFLYDRRATPMLMLGNALFFGIQVPDIGSSIPGATRMATSLADLFANSSYTVDALRQSVKDTTSYTTQGLLGVTVPLNKTWQVGADLRITNVGEVPPVASIQFPGQGKSDNLSVGGQLIGTNLYSARDTHVIAVSGLRGTNYSLTVPDSFDRYHGLLVSYNNSSQLTEFLLLEPSLRYYWQKDSAGVKTSRWAPGLRATYRVAKQVSVESELSAEFGKVSGPMHDETSSRVFYYVGGRYDF